MPRRRLHYQAGNRGRSDRRESATGEPLCRPTSRPATTFETRIEERAVFVGPRMRVVQTAERSMRLIPYSEEHLSLSLAMETNAEVMEHLGGPRPAQEVRKVHPKRVETAAGGLPYLVILSDDSDEPAGTIGIFESEHDGQKVYEMGWMLLPQFHGRGLATEAGRIVIERARADPKIETVYAFPATDNPASNAICRKIGFEVQGATTVEFSGRPLTCNTWRIDLTR